MVSNIAEHYFECHVTIEPIFEERLAQASEIAKRHYFRVAELLMKKREEDTETRSKYDTFMTGRNKYYDKLQYNMVALIIELKGAGFVVWRYKIEDTIIDSKIDDLLLLIK
jgi:hypothetical protein